MNRKTKLKNKVLNRMITKPLAILVISGSLSSNLPAQNNQDPTFHYTVVTSVIHESVLDDCLVSGSIEATPGDNPFKPRIVTLTSDSNIYFDTIDTRNNFDFGFIKPGKYHIRLVNSFSVDIVQPFKANPDTVTFLNGSFYDLQVLNGLKKNDSCCRLGYTFVLPIYFELDSDSLNNESIIVIEGLFEMMQQHQLKIEIGVHTDGRTSRKISTCITCKRAEAIKSHLIKLGANSDHIEANGYQGSTPYFINAKTEEQHQMNRRVVITVL